MINCGTATISRHIEGWLQYRLIGGSANPNVEVYITRATQTSTNAAGDTYVFRTVDADRYWVEDGMLMVSFHGQTAVQGRFYIGVVTFDLATGEAVFQEGRVEPLPKVQACNALT